MEFTRSGASHEANVDYYIEFESPKEKDKTIEVHMQISPTDRSSPWDFQIGVPDAGQLEEITEGEEYLVVIDFNQTEQGWVDIKNPAGNNPQASLKLDVPHPRVFEICRTIVEGHGLYGSEEWIKERFASEREGYHLIKFRVQAEKILKYKQYISVLSFLADQHPRVGRVIAENSLGDFKNRVINASEPQSVSSFSDLCYKIGVYNEQDFLTSIDINDVLLESMDEVYKRQRNSGYNHVKHIIERILPLGEKECKKLSRKVCAIYLSCLLKADKESVASEIFNNWLEADEQVNGMYSQEIYEFEQEPTQPPLSKTEFGQYLYYIGKNELEKGGRVGTLSLFEASSYLLSEEDSLKIPAEFWSLIRHGQRQLHSNDAMARDAFGEALSLVSSVDSSEHDTDQWRKDALSGKYRAIVSDYESDSESESAIQYLTHFMEDDLSDFDSDSDLALQVKALRHDLISKENIRNSSIELAEDNLRRALELYSEADLEKSEARMYARLQLMKGFLDELEADFGSASDRYEVVSTIHFESLENKELAKEYKDISELCAAKSELLQGEIEKSNQCLDEVTGKTSEIISHRDSLRQINMLLQDYSNGEVSGGLGHSSPITTSRVTGLIGVEYDQDEAQFVIYAAQYLRQYGFTSEIVNTIIDIALTDSLTPNLSEIQLEYDEPQKSEEQDLLMELSIEEVWQSKLPTHIHYQIEKTKIDEITAAGDFSGLTNELTKTLEILLVVISEYYSRKSYGEIVEDINPLDRTAIGGLIDFVRKLPAEDFPVVQDFDSMVSEDILPDREISEIRNAGHHGSDIRHTKDQYEHIRDKIVDIFKKLAPFCPIIVQIEDQTMIDLYLCVVHWGGIKTRIWLKSDDELEIGQLYYLPPDKIGENHLVDVGEDSVYPCKATRAQKVSEVNPVTFGPGDDNL